MAVVVATAFFLLPMIGIVRQGGSDMPGIPDREITDEAVAAIGIYLRTLTPAAPGVTPAPAPPAA